MYYMYTWHNANREYTAYQTTVGAEKSVFNMIIRVFRLSVVPHLQAKRKLFHTISKFMMFSVSWLVIKKNRRIQYGALTKKKKNDNTVQHKIKRVYSHGLTHNHKRDFRVRENTIISGDNIIETHLRYISDLRNSTACDRRSSKGVFVGAVNRVKLKSGTARAEKKSPEKLTRVKTPFPPPILG